MKWYVIEIWNSLTCTTHFVKIEANSAREAKAEMESKISHDRRRVIMGIYKEMKGR